MFRFSIRDVLWLTVVVASAGGALVVRVLLGSPNRGKSFFMLIAG